MLDAIYFLSAPLAMCLILVGIHCYLGLHVLARGVIFVDLALAQVAALGTTIAFMFSHEHDSSVSYLISLACTFLAAYFFSIADQFKKKVPLEAIIGVVYAFSSAVVVLLIDKMSHGAEHLKYALVGQLLWVTWPEVLKTFLIYLAVSVIHFIFREQFFKNSFEGKTSGFWDFLFYALFGVVITSSVHVSGVLLVFSFLIVPSVMATIFYQDTLKRLIFGWVLGFMLSCLGMALSFYFDLPSGAFIVVVFTSTPIIYIISKALLKNLFA